MGKLQENKMGTAPLFRLILSMSIPAMFAMLIQSLYNVVDSYFVAKISEDAFTAVSLALPAQMLIIAVSVGTAVGINSLVARRLGEGKQKDADSAATHGFILGVVNWIVFAILGITVVSPFFKIMTSEKEIQIMGTQYLTIVMVLSAGIFIEINLEKTLQATGNMLHPMMSQTLGAIVNMILDPIFIFGMLGLPKMGVIGAAIATVVGQSFAMLYVIFVCFFRKQKIKITLKGFAFSYKTVKDIYTVGFPAMIMNVMGSVLLAGINGILVTFTKTAVAFYGAYFKLQSFIFMPLYGLTHGLMPIMGYNYGARNKKRLISCIKIGCIITVVMMACGTALFLLIPDLLLKIFEASPKMLEIGIPALRIISLHFILAGIDVILSTLFQSIGFGVRSLFISVLRQLIIILPLAYFLSKIGLIYVWWAFPIAEAVALIVSVIVFIDTYNKKIKNLSKRDIVY